MSLISLRVKESKDIKGVNPSELHEPTGLVVTGGERYAFHAEGQWCDWIKKCGPEGWGCGNPLVVFNRVHYKPFFMLCGNIGKDDRLAFSIGACLRKWTVPPEVDDLSDRQLYLFANDWSFMYWNNYPLPPEQGGPLKVRITRIV